MATNPETNEPEAVMKREKNIGEELEKIEISQELTKESSTSKLAEPHEVKTEATTELPEESSASKLAGKQRTTAGWVTRVRNEILKLMENTDNLELVKTKLATYNELFQKYIDSHEALKAILTDEELELELARHTDKDTANFEFLKCVFNWVKHEESAVGADLDRATIRSLSARGSKRSDKRSTRSSSRSTSLSEAKFLAEKTRVTELQTEMTFLQQKLQIQRKFLQQKQDLKHKSWNLS